MATSHSADVRMELHVQGIIVSVGQLGPDFLIARGGTTLAPGRGILKVIIDGKEEAGEISLPNGIRPEVTRTPIRKAAAFSEAA